MNDKELVKAQDALLADLLRMRTDIGHMTLSRTLTGAYQASFKVFGGHHYTAAVKLDPISALVTALGAKDGQDLDELANIAKQQTPTFDLANTPKALVEEEAEAAAKQGRMPAQLLSDILAAKKAGKFVGDVKPKPEIKVSIDDEPAPKAKLKKHVAVDDDLL